MLLKYYFYGRRRVKGGGGLGFYIKFLSDSDYSENEDGTKRKRRTSTWSKMQFQNERKLGRKDRLIDIQKISVKPPSDWTLVRIFSMNKCWWCLCC